MVGRSREVKGPYVDRAGTAMLQGGGTQVVAGDGAWKAERRHGHAYEGAGTIAWTCVMLDRR
jgi:arabinan endo-1,5-alpha-L-arabinosidase